VEPKKIEDIIDSSDVIIALVEPNDKRREQEVKR
jgi:hypothetical protein